MLIICDRTESTDSYQINKKYVMHYYFYVIQYYAIILSSDLEKNSSLTNDYPCSDPDNGYNHPRWRHVCTARHRIPSADRNPEQTIYRDRDQQRLCL